MNKSFKITCMNCGTSITLCEESVEALKKQTPKKVRYPLNSKKDPICGVCCTRVYNQKFCHECGQKLDWDY